MSAKSKQVQGWTLAVHVNMAPQQTVILLQNGPVHLGFEIDWFAKQWNLFMELVYTILQKDKNTNIYVCLGNTAVFKSFVFFVTNRNNI